MKEIPNDILESLRRTHSQEALDAAKARREDAVSQLPKVSLEEQHIANTKYVLNRKALLQRIGKQNAVAELGVDQAEFSREILNITNPTALHLIDTWGCGRYHKGKFNEVTGKFKEELESGKVQIHRKRSTDAAPDFEDGYFDMIYIDTNHSYSTTRAELNSFLPKMKPDGIIAGHDYTMGNWVTSYRYGVIEAVHEFCVQQNWEIIYLTAETLENQSFAIRKIG